MAKVVATADLQKLKKDLGEETKAAALQKLASQVDQNHVLIEPSVHTSVLTEKFNHKADDIADSVSLSTTIRAEGMSLAQSDLDQVIANEIKDQIPPQHLTTKSEHQISVKTADAKSAVLGLSVTATLIPQLNEAEIINNIKGKTLPAAVSYLKELPGVTTVDTVFHLPLPKFLLHFPLSSQNISVVIIPQ
jgi:hypothetical protein